MLLDLFANGSILLAKEIILTNYINSLGGNEDTKSFSNNIRGKSNNILKSKGNDNIVKEQRRDLKNNNNEKI